MNPHLNARRSPRTAARLMHWLHLGDPHAAPRMPLQQVLTQPQTARFAAFFRQEDSARAALNACLALQAHESLGAGQAAHCQLLSSGRAGESGSAAPSLPGFSSPGAEVRRALLLGGIAGAFVGTLLGAWAEVIAGPPGSSLLSSEWLLLSWAAVGAALGAGAGVWMSMREKDVGHARRFDRTVRRRIKQGDSAVLISGLPEWQMAPLVDLLQQRCERWCQDAGAQARL